MDIFIDSALIGLTLAALIGPIATLCIHRTLTLGMFAGFIVGFGAASADAIYALIAAYGLTALTDFLLDHALFIRTAGSIFLLYLAASILLTHSKKTGSDLRVGKHPLVSYFNIVALTLSNPLTIITFLSFFTSFNLFRSNSINPIIIVLGVFSGSLLFYCLLVLSMHAIGKKISLTRYLNPVMGVIILLFALNGLVNYS